jgi:hypothetical protein
MMSRQNTHKLRGRAEKTVTWNIDDLKIQTGGKDNF